MKLPKYLVELAFIAAAVVGGTYTIFVDRGKVTDRERTDRAHDVFPAYRRGDIDSLELDWGKGKLRVERRPDPGDGGDFHWQVTSPVNERADPAAVDRLIGDLEFAGAIRKVDPSAAAEIAKGFDPPRVQGTLSMKPLAYHFALGGPAPVPDGAAYFRVDGEGTFVVSKDFVAALTSGADAYRERSIVPYLSLDLAELTVENPSGGFTVTRVDDTSFKLGKSGLRASRDGMDKVWGALAEARAESFLSEDEAGRALGPSAIRVVMTPRNTSQPRGEILLGGPCPGHPEGLVLVRVSPGKNAACVPKGAAAGLLLTADALVDRRLFASRADEVEELSFETLPTGLTVELARKGKGWHERKPSDRELVGTEIDAMNDLVAKLTRGEAASVRSGAAQGPSVPTARVRLRRGGGGAGAEEVVDLEGGTELVRRAFDGAELHVATALGRRLVPSEIVLRGRAVFPEGLAGRAPTAVRVDCDGVRQAATHDANGWTLHEPRGFTADGPATSDLVTLLRNAQADSWVADRDDGTFGLDGSRCHVELDASGDAGVRTLGLVFGNESEGGTFYARATGDAAVFLAPRALRDGATVWLIDRGPFRATPGSVRRITVSRGGKRAVFPVQPGAGDGGATGTVSGMLRALDGLRPDEVIHLGPPRTDEGLGAPTLDVRVEVANDAGPRAIHFTLGDTALVNRERIIYARVDGVDATFGFARERIAPFADAL